jgi:hypothetical protein
MVSATSTAVSKEKGEGGTEEWEEHERSGCRIQGEKLIVEINFVQYYHRTCHTVPCQEALRDWHRTGLFEGAKSISWRALRSESLCTVQPVQDRVLTLSMIQVANEGKRITIKVGHLCLLSPQHSTTRVLSNVSVHVGTIQLL